MPDNIARVYPASGATAMLPLTPANNWNPTVMFCGGSDMPDEAWGNYSWPFINTWDYPASKRCHRITPEPTDGSAPVYVEDDPMLESRTMGQFIALPDGTLLVVNGGNNGTAGYSTQTLLTHDYSEMPLGMSLAAGPAFTPAIFDPRKAAGQRWSNQGLDASTIPRLYHSSALLLPDASVLVAGSNPNVDVNLTTIYPTTYKAEIFYPPYMSATTRPVPQGVPKTLSYGGASFDVTLPASSYSGSANDAADSTMVMVMRPGFTTHAMNMGQRSLQLNNTYTVQDNGTIVLHVAQMPPNPNIYQPGPALVFVTVNGIPSNGTYVIIGSGQIGTQPTSAVADLPANVRSSSAKGTGTGTSASNSSTSNNNSPNGAVSHTGPIIGGIVGAVALVALLGAVIGVCISRRRRAASQSGLSSSYLSKGAGMNVASVGGAMASRGMRSSDSSAFVPLQHEDPSAAWSPNNASSYSVESVYRDQKGAGRSGEFDPYLRSDDVRGSSAHLRY